MEPAFELDFRRSVEPVRCAGAASYHGRIRPPESPLDPRRGLRFPLETGAVAFESRDKVNDAKGSLEILFAPDAVTGAHALVGAFGQYKPLIEIAPGEVRLNVYHHELRLLVGWRPGRLHRLRLRWDHSAGLVLEVKPSGGPAQRLVRRMHWRAFRQKYVPFSIGGMLGGRPVFTEWSGTFCGWVRSVRTWGEPTEVPGPAARALDLPEARPPFPAHRDVRLLDLHSPPIYDSPWRRDTIPDRFDDLLKTRRVARLDEVVAKCRSEIEVFRKLTWHVSRMWPHFHYWPWPPTEQRHIFWKRGHEMAPQIAAGEMGGMCGGFAHVMEEFFWALGFDARRTQVYAHSTFEAYSNQYDRWITCDASQNRNCCLFVDAAGTPLGAYDFIRRHERLEHDPTAFDDVRTAICQEDGSARLVETPFWRNYTHVGIGLGDPNAKQGDRPHIWYFQRHERPAFEATVDDGGKSKHVERLADLFWSCQRARVSLAWAKPGTALRVEAEPFQVTFPDGFERRIDEGAWERFGAGGRQAAFTWTLHPGVNALEVRTRNRLGATGHPWRIQLWRRP